MGPAPSTASRPPPPPPPLPPPLELVNNIPWNSTRAQSPFPWRSPQNRDHSASRRASSSARVVLRVLLASDPATVGEAALAARRPQEGSRGPAGKGDTPLCAAGNCCRGNGGGRRAGCHGDGGCLSDPTPPMPPPPPTLALSPALLMHTAAQHCGSEGG